MAELRVLVFDVDGTLSETEEVHRRAFNETFTAFGLPWHWDRADYRELLQVTGGKERIRHFIAEHDPPGVHRGDPVRMVAEMHTAKTALYKDLIAAGGATLRPGVERLIRHAHAAGMRLAIATTTSAPNVSALLRATLGTSGEAMFDVIASGDMVANKKPAPDLYLRVVDELRLPAASCLAFEDSENGLLSARAAGLPTLITPSAYTDHQSFLGALAVVDDLDHGGAAFSDGPVDIAGLRALIATQ